MNINTKIIVISLIACVFCTAIGYFTLLVAGHAYDSSGEFPILLIPGYILTWPAFVFGFAQKFINGNTEIPLSAAAASQLIGYIFMGYAYCHVRKFIKNKNT